MKTGTESVKVSSKNLFIFMTPTQSLSDKISVVFEQRSTFCVKMRHRHLNLNREDIF